MEKIDCTHDEILDISKIVDHPQNPNTHSDEQVKRLAEIIDYQGQRSPLVICKDTGFLIVGHGRKYAMQKLGWSKCAVDYQSFSDDAQRYAHMTADNAIGAWSQLDLSQINKDIVDFGPELDLDMLGLKDFVVEPIEKLDPLTDEDSVPELKDDPITKRGDVWLLGNHRVMCGDSTMIDDVEKLMNGEKADMVFTDPPYGIGESSKDFKSRGKLAKAIEYKKSNWDDNIPSEDFFQILLGLNKPSYVFGGNYFTEHLPPSGSWIVWNKKNGSNDFSDCELAWSNHKNAVRYYEQTWNGMIREGETGKRVHPTQKPIALSEFCFNQVDNSKSVLDFFLGSGSTLIACEKTNRKCFGMELDEHYCDVIINRWQEYTGKSAILESSGESYNDLKKAESNV